MEKHFVVSGEQSYWSICIQYADLQQVKASSETRRPKIDYKEILNEQEFAVFAALRELRKQIAESEGVPVFAIFTNEQLAKMVQENTLTKSQMSNIEGIGEAKLSKYAEAFLAKIAGFTRPGSGAKG